jgi:hypothetical protein
VASVEKKSFVRILSTLNNHSTLAFRLVIIYISKKAGWNGEKISKASAGA